MRYSYACELVSGFHTRNREPKARQGLFVVSPQGGHDEPESLILAQSERWRHA